MKEYNAKIIVDDDKFDILFDCDKELNDKCNKKNCDYCSYTTDSRYAKAVDRVKRFEKKKNITDKEVIESLEKEIEYYRYQIELITRDNEEKVKELEEKLKESQKAFKEIMVDGKCLYEFTPNQARKLLGLEPLKNWKD